MARAVRYASHADTGDGVVGGEEEALARIEELVRAGRGVTRVVPQSAKGRTAVRQEVRRLVGAGIGVELEPGWSAAEVEAVFGGAPVVGALDAGPEVLAWVRGRALFGKRVLVTRTREQASETVALLRSQGAEAVAVPVIEIRPPGDPEPLRRAVSDLRAGRYAWAAFTSANGVDRTFAEIAALGADARALASARVAAIGPATARALEKQGIRADVVAREFRGEGLASGMLEAMGRTGFGALAVAGAGTRVLLARAAKARDALPEALRGAGCEVDVVVAYETHAPPAEIAAGLAEDLEAGRIDAVAFTSGSTVENLCDLLGPSAPSLLARPRVAAIGPITRDAAVARGLRVDVVPAEYTVPALVAALASSYG